MKTIERTTSKIIIEVPIIDILNDGFEKTWDKLREVYPNKLYNLDKIQNDEFQRCMIICLIKIKKINGLSL